MGLIKTGLTLAGGFGLIKAASRAVNDYEDKKQRRSTQSQYQPHKQYYPYHEPQLSYTQANQPVSYRPYRPEWSSSDEAQYHHGNHTSNKHSQKMQSRSRRSSGGEKKMSSSPPRYYRALLDKKQDYLQPGSTQGYISGKKQ